MRTLVLSAALLAAAAPAYSAYAALDVCAEQAPADAPVPVDKLQRLSERFSARTTGTMYKEPVAAVELASRPELDSWARMLPAEVRAPLADALRAGPIRAALRVSSIKGYLAYVYSEAERDAAAECAAWRKAEDVRRSFAEFGAETKMDAIADANEDAARARAAWEDAYGTYLAARLYLKTMILPYPNPFVELRPNWDYSLAFAPAAR